VARRLAQKKQQAYEVSQHIGSLRDELIRMWHHEHRRRAIHNDVYYLKQFVSYQHKLKLDIAANESSLSTLRREEKEVQSELIAARKKRRSLEQLRDRRFAAWKKEYTRWEQKQIDEVSQKIFTRQNGPSGALQYSS
jgi:flagellar export protein FliJ